MQKKGQAAMEFLMTYGWAILAAIIAIGVLAYFGVFNPSRLAGSSAVLNAPLNVNAFNIEDNSAVGGCGGNDCVNIEATQNGGQSIDIISTNITITSGAAGYGCTNTSPISTGWASGTTRALNFSCGSTTAFSKGTAIAGTIEIRYVVSGSSIPQASTGNIRGVVQ